MGFTHVILFGHMTGLLSYDWFKHIAQLTPLESADGFHTITHYES